VAIPAAGCSGPEPAAPSLGRPNVVLYLVDTLRADHLGAYGYGRPTSPRMDAFAEGGVLFEQAYAMDTRTLGSIPSLLMSRHTISHGIASYGDQLAPGDLTVASVLREAGYDTAAFVTNFVAGRLLRPHRGFGRLELERPPGLTLPEDAFFEWLDGARTGPFFAYVHTAEPHRPYAPPSRYAAPFDPADYMEELAPGREPDGGADASKRARRHARYDGEVRFADAGFGRLVDGLRRRGLLARTLLVLTADHGEELGDHGGWHHGQTVYNELLRVPLVMAGPGLPRGKRVREPVQLIDVAPTILQATGIAPPDAFQGKSLLELAGGQRPERVADKEIYTRSTQPPRKAVLIQGRFKLIVDADGPSEDGDGTVELYDLDVDPHERHDLARQDPGRANALRERLRSLLQGLPSGEAGGFESLSPEDVESLRELGYVESP